MALRSMTVHRYEEIRRRLAEGRSLHEIARALSCSRCTVREVRDGERLSPDAPKLLADPLWMTHCRGKRAGGSAFNRVSWSRHKQCSCRNENRDRDKFASKRHAHLHPEIS